MWYECISESWGERNTNLIMIWRANSKQEQRVQDESEKTGREKTESQTMEDLWRICPCCLALTRGPVTHSWRIMHKAAWDQRNTGLQLGQRQKETSKESNSHTHTPPRPAPLPSPPSSLHRINPLTLSQGLFFVVVINATSMELERLCGGMGGWGTTNLPPFLLSCIDLVITQM